MKLVNFSVFMVLQACAIGQSFAAEDDREWLPAPDGFKWPAPSKITLGQSKSIDFKKLTEEQRKCLEGFIEGYEFMDSVSAHEVDLNGDGVFELFIHQPSYSGTGGSYYEIVTPDKGGFRSIGSVQGGVVLCEPAKGSKWLRIETCGRAGGGHYTRILDAFVDKKYEPVRIEDHDTGKSKVTVRPIEKE